ncbi:hypothetical protein L596_011066 [Steinernema carpocapsae]|uniref:MH2 domain-containing protein n=1 Tax=Steinernema carpocapsae TaxID=34508 RepID=A0A4U5NSC1_STECR|nr:hypothetical protein L596_011066 [Steinernema carpocapsae]
MVNNQETYTNGNRLQNRKQPQIVPDSMDEIVNETIEPKPMKGTSNKWISITHYQFSERIAAFEGIPSLIAVDGLVDASAANRFSLSACGTVSSSPKVVQVRREVGCGCHLKKSNGTVTVTNASDASIFVQCPLNNEDVPETVHKLRKTQSMEIYNKQKFDEILKRILKEANNVRAALYDLVNKCRVRISFVKGFGEAYERRPKVTDVPCWVEISFLSALKELDEQIMKAADAEIISSFT